MLNSFKQATKTLFSNPVRTGLTTLGIVIGIATVIIVLSAGEGFRSYINYQVEAFGTNFLTIETRVPPTTRDRNSSSFNGGGGGSSANQAVAITTLRNKDVEDIKQIKNIKGVYGAVIGQKIVSYKQISKNAFVFGASASRFDIDKGVLKIGRPYTETEDKAAAQVVILGYDIAQSLFGNEDPLDKNIRVGEYNFLVIGVYEQRGSFGFSNDDKQIFVPLNTAQKKLLGINHLFFVLAQMQDNSMADATADDVARVVRRNHDITDPVKDDFKVQTSAQGLETFGTILSGVTFLLIAVAAISLLVGGVGIMNIMYVSVTERISEIGLKKSLGAKNSDILKEFLIESILLTVLGGVVGVMLGALVSFGVAKVATAFGFPWKFIVPVSAIVLSFSVAGGIGLIFGVFPARSASKLDPMEALRQE
jgi:putative ABC transport system permease protein